MAEFFFAQMVLEPTYPQLDQAGYKQIQRRFAPYHNWHWVNTHGGALMEREANPLASLRNFVVREAIAERHRS